MKRFVLEIEENDKFAHAKRVVVQRGFRLVLGRSLPGFDWSSRAGQRSDSNLPIMRKLFAVNSPRDHKLVVDRCTDNVCFFWTTWKELPWMFSLSNSCGGLCSSASYSMMGFATQF